VSELCLTRRKKTDVFLQLRVIVAASLLLVLFGVFVGAQVHRGRTPVTPPIVLSGSDVGFQITAREGTIPVGSVVVRVDGNWVPVEYERTVSRMTAR
jgi:hypothetical protein